MKKMNSPNEKNKNENKKMKIKK